MKRLAIALAAAAVIGTAVPASAQGLYVGVGDPYYGGSGVGWGTWTGGYGGYWGGPSYAYGWGPGYWGGPSYAYAWDNPGYTVTYRRPRARVYAYESVPRYRYRRVARDAVYGAYAYSGPDYRYGGFRGPGYRDWDWGWGW
jgi:hypothetical protein